MACILAPSGSLNSLFACCSIYMSNYVTISLQDIDLILCGIPACIISLTVYFSWMESTGDEYSWDMNIFNANPYRSTAEWRISILTRKVHVNRCQFSSHMFWYVRYMVYQSVKHTPFEENLLMWRRTWPTAMCDLAAIGLVWGKTSRCSLMISKQSTISLNVGRLPGSICRIKTLIIIQFERNAWKTVQSSLTSFCWFPSSCLLKSDWLNS